MSYTNLKKEIKDLEREWTKRFEKSDMHQPGGGIDDKNNRDWFRDGYKVSYEHVFKDVQKLIQKEEEMDEIEELLSKVVILMKKKGTIGKRCEIDGDYVMVDFKPMPLRCKECAQVIK